MSFLSTVAVVTGANKGIGLSIVKLLCRHDPNLTVYLTSRDVERGQAAVKALQSEFKISPRFHQLDVESISSVRTFRSYLSTHHPEGISILVNNAGIYFKTVQGKPFVFDPEKWRKTMSINYFGVLNVCNELFPLLTDDARVVLVSSRIAQIAYSQFSNQVQEQWKQLESVEQVTQAINQFLELSEDQYHSHGFAARGLNEIIAGGAHLTGDSLPYGVSKLGLNLLTRIYQQQFDACGKSIAVNACHPGLVRTDLNLVGTKTPDEGADSPFYLATLPAGTSIKGVFVNDERTVTDSFKL